MREGCGGEDGGHDLEDKFLAKGMFLSFFFSLFFQ